MYYLNICHSVCICFQSPPFFMEKKSEDNGSPKEGKEKVYEGKTTNDLKSHIEGMCM